MVTNSFERVQDGRRVFVVQKELRTTSKASENNLDLNILMELRCLLFVVGCLFNSSCVFLGTAYYTGAEKVGGHEGQLPSPKVA